MLGGVEPFDISIGWLPWWKVGLHAAARCTALETMGGPFPQLWKVPQQSSLGGRDTLGHPSQVRLPLDRAWARITPWV